MSVFVVSRDATDYARAVTEFLWFFEKQTAEKIEAINPDTREGAEICRLYDIVEYPTVIATASDGQLRNSWSGLPLPSVNEVSYYVQ